MRSRPLPPLVLLVAPLVAGLIAACSPKGAKPYNEAQKALAGKKYDQAIAKYQQAIRENPEFAEAHYNLGSARYRLAVHRLERLIAKQGAAPLKKALQETTPEALRKRTNVPPAQARLTPQELTALKTQLATLPVTDTEPILELLKQSFADKAKAYALFKTGKWVVVGKPRERKRMLDTLAEVAKLQAYLYPPSGTDRGLLLLALARPTLVHPAPARPAPRPATRPAPRRAAK